MNDHAAKGLLFAFLLCACVAMAKDTIDVEVSAVHAVTHDDNRTRAVLDKGILGSHSITRQVESYNLDAIVNGEHVVLACDDSKGCEAPALGKYEGELKRSNLVKLKFSLPVLHRGDPLVQDRWKLVAV